MVPVARVEICIIFFFFFFFTPILNDFLFRPMVYFREHVFSLKVIVQGCKNCGGFCVCVVGEES